MYLLQASCTATTKQCSCFLLLSHHRSSGIAHVYYCIQLFNMPSRSSTASTGELLGHNADSEVKDVDG